MHHKVVDAFLIQESSFTNSGQPKPLNLLKVGGRSILSIAAFRGSRMDGWESTEIK